jgi:hypothetical protein
VCGGTLCYLKSYWEGGKFPDINIGEDNAFVWARRDKVVAVNRAVGLYVATVHPGNTSPKATADRRWRDYPVRDIAHFLSS